MNEKIEVVAIGTEILKGFTINTNAADIGKELFKSGYLVSRHTVLPDQPALLKIALQECLQRSRIVITTGGLGPTCDDCTKKVAAEIFDSDFYFDESIAQTLKQRYGSMLISLNDQATVPTKAFILKNEVGTAPGLVFNTPSNTLILMPGVSREMHLMLRNQVIPYLISHFPQKKRQISQALHFFGISESTIDPSLRELEKNYPGIEFGIYPSHGTLTVSASIETSRESEGNALLSAPLNILAARFNKQLFESSSGKIEETIHNLFIKNGWTLSIAESCTGGSLSAKLTQLPNASAYFLGSIVCYSNFSKEKFLGVSKDLLQTKGAVSEESVLAMASGILASTGSDFGLAITGIAGPSGGTPDKPIGTVWIGTARKGAPPKARLLRAHGSRQMIIERSANAALGELLMTCLEKDA